MQICKWGNSLAVRLPAKLVAELGLKEGDEIELRPAADGALEIEKQAEIDALFAAIRAIRRPLPAGYKFDREELHERGRGDEE